MHQKYMYMTLYTCIFIQLHVHTYMHTYVQLKTYIYTHVYVYICFIFSPPNIHIYIFTSIIIIQDEHNFEIHYTCT